MSDDGDAPTTTTVPLTVLADRYAVIKAEVAEELHARQMASRFGGTPAHDDGRAGKQDARRIAAERLGAGVLRTTLEKVLWLLSVAVDRDRHPRVRQAARDAYEEVEAGGPVSWPYDRVHTLVLIDDLELAVADAPDHSVVKVVAERQVELLHSRGVYAVTSAMKREARKALKDAQQADAGLEAWAERAAPVWPEIEASLKRYRGKARVAYEKQRLAARQALLDGDLHGGANV